MDYHFKLYGDDMALGVLTNDEAAIAAFKSAHPNWVMVPARIERLSRPASMGTMSRMRRSGVPRERAPAMQPSHPSFGLARPSAPSPSMGMPASGGDIIQAQFRRGGGGPTPTPGGGFRDLTPEQEMLAYRYEQAQAEIARLEPNSPYRTIMRAPNTPPGAEEVNRLETEVTAARARAAAGVPPRGSAPISPRQPRVKIKDWDEPTPEHEAAEAAASGRTAEEYADLACDPAHGGMIDDKSRQERRVGVALERSGVIPGPIRRDLRPKGGEFIDADGEAWDVKAFNSKYPPSLVDLRFREAWRLYGVKSLKGKM